MGEFKLNNLDTPKAESSAQAELSLIHSEVKIAMKKPNQIQSWLIEVIASALSYMIVLFFMTLIGIFFKSNSDKN